MKSKFVLLVLLTILSTTICQAQSSGSAAILFADSLMNARYPASNPGAVLLIAKDGQPILKKAMVLQVWNLAYQISRGTFLL